MEANKSAKNSLSKILPHNIEAEEALLGSIFINGDSINKIVDAVTADDFYNPANHDVFDAFISLFNEKSPIDLVTVTEKLESKKRLDAIGGAAYLSGAQTPARS